MTGAHCTRTRARQNGHPITFSRNGKCYNCVTPAARPDRDTGSGDFDKMIIKLTKRERDTILAALRRWLSYPAAREADSIATNRGKHEPLDNAEIERLCKRITNAQRKGDAAAFPRQSTMAPGRGKRPKTASNTKSSPCPGTQASRTLRYESAIVEIWRDRGRGKALHA